VFNIQKAVSRLEFAPKANEIQITDIKQGLAVFTPKPDKAVSFAALQEALKKAGYTLDAAEITLTGTLTREGEEEGWRLVADPARQSFTLKSAPAGKRPPDLTAGAKVEVTGDWKTEKTSTTATTREVITVRSIKPADKAALSGPARKFGNRQTLSVKFFRAAYVAGTSTGGEAEAATAAAAPIRTTSPGLTVYKGGAVTSRLHYVRQRLGNLSVNRQVFDLSMSYTPTPRVQLEVEAPVSRTSFREATSSGSGVGLGNVTVWSKYRFFRQVKTYGDRQAAIRFGLELPTGDKDAPDVNEVNAPDYVRQQLTPISGGLSPHIDVAFSQAGGRFIFGGNAEGILRSARSGFRTGHEIRVGTDTEYVLLPRNYRAPGKELFVILETSFVQRCRGRVNGIAVDGSKSTEFYLAPGLQYAADPRFVIEGSVQLPVVRQAGPLVLRTTVNALFGVRFLF
jgi:hypothetical protein